VLFDAEGFLMHAEDWSDDLADALAAEAGLTAGLDDVQWRAVRYMRTFYAENGRGPLNRQLAKGTGLTLLELEGMFPGGIRNGARRLAGLPNPKSCM
jgi:TusE/DsrC/DsvC family sulfur relay protein